MFCLRITQLTFRAGKINTGRRVSVGETVPEQYGGNPNPTEVNIRFTIDLIRASISP